MPLRFGQFEIDENTYELRLRGRTLRPSRLVFDTILILGKHAPRVVTKEELIAGPWRGHTVSDDAIYRCIFRARQILAVRDCIVTVRGRGFRLVLPSDDPSPPKDPR